MTTSCLEKQNALKIDFERLASAESRYQKLIELGQALPILDPAYHTPEYIVPGCQSSMYLRAELKEGLFYLSAHSDALISKGLAALFIYIYNEESPKTILTCKPTVLEELGIMASLSPTRAIGLNSIYQKLQKLALQSIIS